MIGAPVLWAAFLAWTPPPTDFIGCDVIARDPVAYYAAHGDIVTPGETLAWQCVAPEPETASLVEDAKPKPRKRYRRRR